LEFDIDDVFLWIINEDLVCVIVMIKSV